MQADATAKQKNIKKLLIYFGGQDSVGYSFVYVVTLVIFERYLDPDPASCRETKRANNLATRLSRSWHIHFSHLTVKTLHRLLFISQLTWRIFLGLGLSFFYRLFELNINVTTAFPFTFLTSATLGSSKNGRKGDKSRAYNELWRFLKERPMSEKPPALSFSMAWTMRPERSCTKRSSHSR